MITHPWVQLALPVTGYTLVVVHVTLAQRVLHPSLTLNVDVRIIVCTHVKIKSSVFQKITQRLYYVSSITKVPGVVKTLLASMVY